jgi:hypothetical protein
MGKMAAFLKKFYTAKMAGAPPWGQKKKSKACSTLSSIDLHKPLTMGILEKAAWQ